MPEQRRRFSPQVKAEAAHIVIETGGFEVGDAGDQLGPVGSFDFGAELEAAPAAELGAFGAEPADLVPGERQVGAQAGLGARLRATGG